MDQLFQQLSMWLAEEIEYNEKMLVEIKAWTENGKDKQLSIVNRLVPVQCLPLVEDKWFAWVELSRHVVN